MTNYSDLLNQFSPQTNDFAQSPFDDMMSRIHLPIRLGGQLTGFPSQPTPQKIPTFWDERIQDRRGNRKPLDELLDQRPEKPSMYPRPGTAAIVALLSGLANNQFRPDDDPFSGFMNAYQGVKNDQYQRQLDKWQRDVEAAKNKTDEHDLDAEDELNQYRDSREDQMRKQNQVDLERADQQDSDAQYMSAKQDAINALPPERRSAALRIDEGMKRANDFYKMAQSDEDNWKRSGLEGPELHAWQESDGKGLSPVQQQLGAAIYHGEMLHQMLESFQGPLSTGQKKAYDELQQKLTENEDLVNKLYDKNPRRLSLSEKQRIMDEADLSIRQGANPWTIYNRTRGLLIGADHPRGNRGYFDDLLPTFGRTTGNGVEYSIMPLHDHTQF